MASLPPALKRNVTHTAIIVIVTMISIIIFNIQFHHQQHHHNIVIIDTVNHAHALAPELSLSSILSVLLRNGILNARA